MRRAFFLNVVLAFSWTAVTGRMSVLELLFGFAIGFGIMMLVRPLAGPAHYGVRLWSLAKLIVLFIWDLIGASLRVAADSLSPRHTMNSGVVSIKLDVKTDAEIAAFAGLISLTPGTLALDVSDDRETLFVHIMHIPEENIAAHEAALKRKIETRVRKVFGPPPD